MFLICICLAPSAWTQAHTSSRHTIITFAVPGAQSTVANDINASGTITGSAYRRIRQFQVLQFGFLRSPDGSFTTFNVGHSLPTYSISINPEGAITGHYSDLPNGANHGFLRAPDGTITKFDVPGAGKEYDNGTVGSSINSAGAIAGYYRDSNSVNHGFLRAPDGTITKIIRAP